MLWVLLGQVLSADHSCRAAVARLIARRLSRGHQQRKCVNGRLAAPQRSRLLGCRPDSLCPGVPLLLQPFGDVAMFFGEIVRFRSVFAQVV